MPETKTVSVLWVRALLQGAAAEGLEQDTLLSAAGIAADVCARLNETEGRITLDDTLRIWRAAEQLSDDALFGFHIGMQLQPTHFRLIAFTMLSSPTLGDALTKIMKFQRLISDGGAFGVVRPETDGGSVRLTYRSLADDFSYHQIDVVMVAILSFARWLTGEHLYPEAVGLNIPESRISPEYEKFYGCPVRGGEQDNYLEFDPAILTQPLPGHDEGLAAVHEQMAESRLQQLTETDSGEADVATRVSQILQEPGNMLMSREEVAEKLSMSGRSLQRRLQEQSVSFQQIQDNTRHRKALELIENDELTLADIGAQLGFSESSTFYRAFRRWEGITPGEYRQKRNENPE